MSFKASLIFAPMLFAVACAANAGPAAPQGDGPNNPTATLLQGDHEVTSKYDLSLSPDFPPVLADALGPLTGLSDNPAGTLIDLLGGAGNGLSDLLDDLPGPLRSIIENEINGYINDKLLVDGLAVGNITEYVDMLATMLTSFEVITDLSVGNTDAAGNANASHTLKAVAFQRDGARIVVQSPDILNTLSTASNVSLNVDFGTRSLAVGDHAFQLPLGDFAVSAFHTALQEEFGIFDLGVALNQMIDCNELAAQVGDVEVIGVVVVTQGDVADFCVQGLNKLPEQLDNQIRKLAFAELHIVGGEGSLQMDSKSVNSMKGSWDSLFGVDGSGISIPSTFEAKRAN